MKKLLGLLLIALMLAGCGAPATMPVETLVTEAPTQTPRPTPTATPPPNFIRYELGTAFDEVISGEGDKVYSSFGELIIGSKQDISGQVASVLYTFSDSGLTTAIYSMYPEFGDPSEIINLYKKIEKTITFYYGESVTSAPTWEGEGEIPDESQWGQVISSGALKLVKEWENQDVRVTLSAAKTDGKVACLVTYISKEAIERINSGEDETIPINNNPIPIEITGIRMGKNSIGTPEVYVDVKNISDDLTVDAYDFVAECYNTYGERVKGYGTKELYAGTEQENALEPGETSRKSWRWTLYGFDTTTKVRVALTKIHTDDGQTWVISEFDYIWVEGSLKK